MGELCHLGMSVSSSSGNASWKSLEPVNPSLRAEVEMEIVIVNQILQTVKQFAMEDFKREIVQNRGSRFKEALRNPILPFLATLSHSGTFNLQPLGQAIKVLSHSDRCPGVGHMATLTFFVD